MVFIKYIYTHFLITFINWNLYFRYSNNVTIKSDNINVTIPFWMTYTCDCFKFCFKHV